MDDDARVILFDPRDRIGGPPSKAPDKPWQVEFRKNNSATPISEYNIPEVIRELNEEWKLGYNEWVLSEHLKKEGARLFIDITKNKVHYGLEDQHPKAMISISGGLREFYSKNLPNLISEMCGEVLVEKESYEKIKSEGLYTIFEDLDEKMKNDAKYFSPYATEKEGCSLTAILFESGTKTQGILIKMREMSN